MLYYLAALLWIYLVSLYAYRLPHFCAVPASLPIVAFSAFRGESGKDTTAYIERFFSTDSSFDSFTIDSEPTITLIISLSRLAFGDDARGFFALHAFILFNAYFLIAKKRSLNMAYLLSVGPVFLLDGITNGMRVTIAYHAILLSYTYGSRLLTVCAFWALAVFAHVTAIVSIALSLALQKPTKALLGLLTVAALLYGLASSGIVDLISLAPRIFSKLDKYADLTLPTWYSGVVDLLMIFALLLISVFTSKSLWHRKAMYGLLSLSFCILLYLGIQESLAFIRISKLVLIALFTSHLLKWKRVRGFQLAIFLLGLFYSANFLRQVSTDPGFLPYGE